MVNYSGIFDTASRGIAAVLLVNVCGSLLAVYPKSSGGLLHRGFIQLLAGLCNNVLQPSLLLYSVGSSFTVELLSEAWVLVPMAAMHLLVGLICAQFLCRFARVHGVMRRPFIACSAIHNSLPMPLLLLTALSGMKPLSDIPDALTRGGYFILTFIWSFDDIILRYFV